MQIVGAIVGNRAARSGRPVWARALSVSLAALMSLGAPVAAQAQTGGKPVRVGLEPSLAVLELYVGDQTYDKTPDYVRKVTEELAKTGRFSLLDRADAERQIRAVMTTSVRRVTEDKLKEIELLMKKGDDLLYTNPKEAIEILAKAKNELKDIMETITLNQKIRTDYFKTQMMLARSHFDNKNRPKAAEILEEIIRVFGDEVKVTEEEYHPDIVALYRDAYRKMSAMQKGRVMVRTEPAGAEVLIHGKVQKEGSPATFDGIYPGVVAVQARKGGRESMIHRVKVDAGSTTELTIDIDYETSMAFSDAQFGFTFPDQGTLKARVADFASRIGKLLKVDYVLVTGLVEADGRTNLEGHLVNVDKVSVERTESLYTKANVVSANRSEQLAMGIADEGYVPPPPVYKPWYTNVVGWSGVGAGVVAGVIGAVMWSDFEAKLEEVNCTAGPPACKTYTERVALAGDAKFSRTMGGIGFGVGGALLAGGVAAFILLREEDTDAMAADADAPNVPRLQALSPTFTPDGGAGFGAAFTF